MATDRPNYYVKLIAKWPELGPPTASAEAVAIMRAARAIPHPIDPSDEVPHWVSPNTPEQLADNYQHQKFQRDAREWHAAWAKLWETPEIAAKLAMLNDVPMVDGTRKTGRMIVVGLDAQSRQILEPETEPCKVPGTPWWKEAGYSGPISAADLHTIFERHGEVLT